MSNGENGNQQPPQPESETIMPTNKLSHADCYLTADERRIVSRAMFNFRNTNSDDLCKDVDSLLAGVDGFLTQAFRMGKEAAEAPVESNEVPASTCKSLELIIWDDCVPYSNGNHHKTIPSRSVGWVHSEDAEVVVICRSVFGDSEPGFPNFLTIKKDCIRERVPLGPTAVQSPEPTESPVLLQTIAPCGTTFLYEPHFTGQVLISSNGKSCEVPAEDLLWIVGCAFRDRLVRELQDMHPSELVESGGGGITIMKGLLERVEDLEQSVIT